MQDFVDSLKLYEFSTQRPEFITTFSWYTSMCKQKNSMQLFCADALNALLGPNVAPLNEKNTKHLMRNFPASISIKQLVHLGQLVRSGIFRQCENYKFIMNFEM